MGQLIDFPKRSQRFVPGGKAWQKVRGQSVDIPLRQKAPEIPQEPICVPGEAGAGGGIRTHTPVKVADFKSAASAIPPPRLAWSQTVPMVVAEERLEQLFVEARCWGDGRAGRGALSWPGDSLVPGGRNAFLRCGRILKPPLLSRNYGSRPLLFLVEATGGFEPPNRGFADLRLSPLGYVASVALCTFDQVPSAGLVPRAGFEPTQAYAHGPLKTACLPIPPPRPPGAGNIIPYPGVEDRSGHGPSVIIGLGILGLGCPAIKAIRCQPSAVSDQQTA